MAPNLVIIKLGGAAITRKQTFETLNDDVLDLCASHIAQLHANRVRLVIVHGAGSFGHHQVCAGVGWAAPHKSCRQAQCWPYFWLYLQQTF